MPRLLILSLVLLLAVGACSTREAGTAPSPALSVTAALTPAAAPAPTTPSRSPRFEPAACAFQVPASTTVGCGYLTVPEDRRLAGGPTIRLHVAIVRSAGERVEPDPLVYLEGGPGGQALVGLAYLVQRFSPMLADRDLVVFDQRGVGYAQPSLDCPELDKLADETLGEILSDEEAEASWHTAAAACRERLTAAGINLDRYTSAASAADLDDLRRALGYDAWNLYGISYGSRLALTTMRDFPLGLRSVILDSVYPPQVDGYRERAHNAQRSFRLLFDQCMADEMCRTEFPDLERVFLELVEDLNAEPITVQVFHPLTRRSHDVALNGDRLVGVLFETFYQTGAIPYLPKTIYEVHRGVTIGLSAMLGRLLWRGEFADEGMGLSVSCAEEAPFYVQAQSSAEAQTRLAMLFEAWAEEAATACEQWGVAAAAAIENEPVRSSIPTLILAGEYDPITPPAWGHLAAASLTHAHYFEFPGVGHGVLFARECALDIATAFLNGPSTAPAATCAAHLPALRFLR